MLYSYKEGREEEMKPIIGVTPLWDDEKSSIWMLPGYLDAIREGGGVPIILPLKGNEEDFTQICEMCSGFLLTGGHDITPSLYSEERNDKCGTTNLYRDSLERIVFDFAVKRDLPLLGICRGIQIINAFCGGTLYQDLPSQYSHPKGVNHQMQPPYDWPCHKVKVVDNTLLSNIVQVKELEVNSYHHQAIKDIALTLKAMAISEDGLVEAIYMPHKSFIMALQWHPEFNYHSDKNSRKIVRAFVDRCNKL